MHISNIISIIDIVLATMSLELKPQPHIGGGWGGCGCGAETMQNSTEHCDEPMYNILLDFVNS